MMWMNVLLFCFSSSLVSGLCGCFNGLSANVLRCETESGCNMGILEKNIIG